MEEPYERLIQERDQHMYNSRASAYTAMGFITLESIYGGVILSRIQETGITPSSIGELAVAAGGLLVSIAAGAHSGIEREKAEQINRRLTNE